MRNVFLINDQKGLTIKSKSLDYIWVRVWLNIYHIHFLAPKPMADESHDSHCCHVIRITSNYTYELHKTASDNAPHEANS